MQVKKKKKLENNSIDLPAEEKSGTLSQTIWACNKSSVLQYNLHEENNF